MNESTIQHIERILEQELNSAKNSLISAIDFCGNPEKDIRVTEKISTIKAALSRLNDFRDWKDEQEEAK